jgi:hypothetical protein
VAGEIAAAHAIEHGEQRHVRKRSTGLVAREDEFALPHLAHLPQDDEGGAAEGHAVSLAPRRRSLDLQEQPEAVAITPSRRTPRREGARHEALPIVRQIRLAVKIDHWRDRNRLAVAAAELMGLHRLTIPAVDAGLNAQWGGQVQSISVVDGIAYFGMPSACLKVPLQ